jgi:hypothetical protein
MALAQTSPKEKKRTTTPSTHFQNSRWAESCYSFLLINTNEKSPSTPYTRHPALK